MAKSTKQPGTGRGPGNQTGRKVTATTTTPKGKKRRTGRGPGTTKGY